MKTASTLAIVLMVLAVVPSAAGQLPGGDQPTITSDGTPDDIGLTRWFRGPDVTYVTFTFEGLDPLTIPGKHVLVNFNLGITNHRDGEAGLDGLLDITVENSDKPEWLNVLFDNVDTSNTVYNLGGGGSYATTASILVQKDAIQGGTLTITLHRHEDNDDFLPPCPKGEGNGAIDDTVKPPAVPEGCFDNDDGHTVHIGVDIKAPGPPYVAAAGEVTVNEAPELRVCEAFCKNGRADWGVLNTEKECWDYCLDTCATVQEVSECKYDNDLILTNIPAVTTWGMVVMGLLVLTAGTMVVLRRRPEMA